MDGVADELLLIALIAHQHIVIGKALDTLQLHHLEHPHLDVDDVVESHELFYLYRHGRVILIDLYAYATTLDTDEVRRPLVHSGNESETRLIYGAAGREELWVHQVELMTVGGDDLARLIYTTPDIVIARVHNPLLGCDEVVFRIGCDTSGRLFYGGRAPLTVLHVYELRIYKSKLVFGRNGGRRAVYIPTAAVAIERCQEVGADERMMVNARYRSGWLIQ